VFKSSARGTSGGVNIDKGVNTTFAGNDVIGNLFGIRFAQESINNTIVGNHVIGNPSAILVFVSSIGTKILSNVTRRFKYVGIVVADSEQANAKVLGNDISGSNVGMFVSNIKGGSVTGNRVHNTCAGVLFAADLPGPVGNFEVKGKHCQEQ